MRFIICLFCLFFRNQSEEVNLLIKALIKEFSLCWTRHFIFTIIIIWICMNLNWFELYLKFMTVMYFILFYFNLWLNICFLNNFVNTHGYPWILTYKKKIGGYPYRYGYGYETDIYPASKVRGTTTHILPAPLTRKIKMTKEWKSRFWRGEKI